MMTGRILFTGFRGTRNASGLLAEENWSAQCDSNAWRIKMVCGMHHRWTWKPLPHRSVQPAWAL